jgi:hypothetical protein
MNTDLKKQAKYQAKYMERHKMLTVNLDKKEDAEIIAWLDKQANRSEAVRKALKEAAR